MSRPGRAPSMWPSASTSSPDVPWRPFCVFAFVFVINLVVSLFSRRANGKAMTIQILGPVAMASILIAFLGGIVWLVGIISIRRSTRIKVRDVMCHGRADRGRRGRRCSAPPRYQSNTCPFPVRAEWRSEIVASSYRCGVNHRWPALWASEGSRRRGWCGTR
jgi:hypothetical protein